MIETDLLYTSKKIKETLNINQYELDKLRTNHRIGAQKMQNGRYVYEMNEALEQEFIKSDNVSDSLSTTSDENNVERVLSDDELEFPEHYGYYNNHKKFRKLTLLQQRDHYIRVYRHASMRPKVSSSIDEVINEMMTPFDDGDYIKLEFDDKFGEKTKNDVIEAMDKFLRILDFPNEGNSLARDWYVDGVLPLELVYDNAKITDGIQTAVKLSPIYLRELKNPETNKKFYKYEKNLNTLEDFTENNILDIYKEEQMIYVGSGLWDAEKVYEISYMRYAIKAINDLAHIENALIKYRITRASEKNIWNVDVGNMAKTKAESHLANVARQVSSNIKYDTDTGETSLDNVEGITSDWLFPSRNGKQKTEVSTINGNSDFISKLEDLEYFRRELYEALKIPIGRLDGDSSLDYSAMDILREELKFTKFIASLRRSFNDLFYDGIRRELIATNKITEQEFDEIKQDIYIKWNESNQIIENGKIENYKMRVDAVEQIKESGIIGKVISWDWVTTNMLNMTEEDFKEQQKKIQAEKTAGFHKEDEQDGNDKNNK